MDRIDSLMAAALSRRAGLFADPETDCFRIFNSSGDGIDGFTADYYSGYLLLQYFRKSEGDRIGMYTDSLRRCFPVIPGGIKGILVKNRVARNETGPDMWRSVVADGHYPPDGIEVRQNGIRMHADLVNGQNTGIFLDMREIRNGLEEFYRRERPFSMLNLFCYTGAFSVHALRCGVKHAVNVDLSKSVLRRAKANYSLNDLEVDERDFVYGDSLERVRIFAKKGTRFDFAVFDPPTFSRNRERNFSVRKDYSGFLEMLQAVVPSGFIFSSVNSVSLSKRDYISFHPSAWELVMFAGESSDFVHSGEPYLKAGLWKIKTA